MSLSIGIVGLPNVGKSTTFNALTNAQNAQAGNFPFCTISPNRAVVPVLDHRLDEIAKIVKPGNIHYSKVEFVDIAGLVKGASSGNGLGNRFLSNIRDCQCLIHLVRCFEDENIPHVNGRIDPVEDIKTIELELIISDLESVENRIKKLQKQLKSGGSSQQLELALELRDHLSEGLPARSFKLLENEHFVSLDRELRFLSNKNVIYGANVDEGTLLSGSNSFVDELKSYVSHDVVVFSSKFEADLFGMSIDERQELLSCLDSGVGLGSIVSLSFNKLGLISYFTAGVKEVRSWSIKNGDCAPRAAASIHRDFEKGFIRAEVISYDDFVRCGGEAGAREKGLLRLEGREYVVKDGDIMHFRFNV